jgi:hypothetical protein
MHKLLIVLAVTLFVSCNLIAYTVDGYAYLDGEADHSGINVAFERTAPDSWNGSTSTNSSGYYTIELDLGVYDITYTKDGYDSILETDKMINSNISLSNVTLTEHINSINVPADYSTIQSAIDYSINGDVIHVQPGTYVENINFNGKNITVASLFLTTQDKSYISQTIIDGNQNGTVITFNSGENSTSILTGFTIRNGQGIDAGGIYIRYSSPSLKNLILDNNSGEQSGGIYCDHSSTSMRNLIISNNTAWVGGGISFHYANVSLTNVLINNNEAYHPHPTVGMGGGIYLFRTNISLSNVTISNNSAYTTGGGVHYEGDGYSISLVNSIVSSNEGNYGMYVESGAASIQYCNFHNNENGNFYNCGTWVGVNATTNFNGHACDLYYNIQLDPLFFDSGNNNYHLSNGSPCLSSATATGAPSDDLDGKSRPLGSGYDIGCYEHYDEGTLPVTLSSFTVQLNDKSLVIFWTTQSESGLLGFTLYKSETDNQQLSQRVNLSPIPACNTSHTQSYSYTDNDVTARNTYHYWLEAVALDGSSELFGPVMLTISEPGTAPPSPAYVTKLCTAYPNPFNPSTAIPFSLKEPSHVKIEVFNTAGQKIQTLIDSEYTEGEHQAVWDGTNSTGSAVSSGIYLYRMKAGTFTDVQKVILMK